MGSNLPTQLDIPANQPFTKAVLDGMMSYIVNRFLILEAFKPDWQQAVDQLNQVGLNRINSALTPVFEAYSEIASLGAIFSATSSSEITIGIGTVTFVIDTQLRNQFAPARWMSALSADASASIAGLVTSYNRTSGQLVIKIMESFGSGTYSEWQISPSSPPMLAAAVVDGGVYDASPAETDAVPYIFDTAEVNTDADGGTF